MHRLAAVLAEMFFEPEDGGNVQHSLVVLLDDGNQMEVHDTTLMSLTLNLTWSTSVCRLWQHTAIEGAP